MNEQCFFSLFFPISLSKYYNSMALVSMSRLSYSSYVSQVVRAFDSLAMSDLTNGMRVGESEVFNSAQQSEEIRWFRRMAFGSQNYSTDYFSENSRGS